MTEKEFRKLSRAEYLELMVEQGREIKRLKEELEQTRSELRKKEIRIEKAGSIAEASLGLNEVFAAAQAAADQYLENIKEKKDAYEKKLQNAEKIIIEKAELANKYINDTKARCEAAEKETAERCAALEEETKHRCAELLQAAIDKKNRFEKVEQTGTEDEI